MRAAEFKISGALLAERLHLPERCRIIGGSFEFAPQGIVTLVVDDPELPEGPEPWSVDPTISRVEWDWNLKP